MNSFNSHRTLILNSTFQPLSVASAKRSVSLLLTNKINNVTIYLGNSLFNSKHIPYKVIYLLSLKPINIKNKHKNLAMNKLKLNYDDLMIIDTKSFAPDVYEYK